MRLLITFALKEEFAPWQRLRKFERLPRAEQWAPDLFAAKVSGCDVRVALTGMGWEHARAAAQFALAEKYDVCISSGLAGALNPEHRCGDVLAARAVAALGTSRTVKNDLELAELAAEQGARVVDRFLCSRELVADAAQKSKLGLLGDAVEMESFPVLSASAGAGTRSIAIRAVSDTADVSLPLDFSRSVDERGAMRLGGILQQLAHRPGKLPQLVRLGKNSRRAAERLAEFLERYIAAGTETNFRAVSLAAVAG